jgi:hypothetical protein
MVKIIKGSNDLKEMENEINKFINEHNGKLLDFKCILKDSRTFIYFAIIEYTDNNEYVCIPKNKYNKLKEIEYMYEGLCK